MKQIKTIIAETAEEFDKEVNDALLRGWKLVRRAGFPDCHYIAELERKTAAEAMCNTCKHLTALAYRRPCRACLTWYKKGKGYKYYEEVDE